MFVLKAFTSTGLSESYTRAPFIRKKDKRVIYEK